MSRRLSIDQLPRMLVRRGMQARAARRLAEELRDHREDLLLEWRAAGASEEEAVRRADEQLGSVERLAEAALAAQRREKWSGRHPLLCFAILPLILTPMAFVLIHLVVLGPFILFGGPSPERIKDWQPLLVGLARTGFLAFPLVMALLYDRAVRRRALGWGWRLLAMVSPIAWGAWCRQTIRLPEMPEKRGMYALGFSAWPSPWQAAMLVCLLAAFLFITELRTRRVARFA